MKSLKKFIREAEKTKTAIGHFNVTNHEMLRAVFDAARELSEEINHPYEDGKIPVIITAL